MTTTSKYICNICESKDINVSYDVPAFDGTNIFTILKCSNCHLVFANVKKSDLDNSYEEDYYSTAYPDYESDEKFHKKNNKMALKEIEQFFKPGKLVEIGSSFGFFLKVAESNGWNCSGFEISKYSSKVAREKYKVDVKNSDFLSEKMSRDNDMLVMLDTIEHLLDPSAVIKKASEVLKPGGGIYIPTGDINSLFARLCGRKWRLMTPPLHIYFYTPETITKLLNKHGFTVLKISHGGKYYNLGSLFQYVAGISKNKIPQIPIKVNMGDVMTVIARYDG